MDTLRASARADMAEKSSARASKAAAQNAQHANANGTIAAPAEKQEPPAPPPPVHTHHEGSFQLTLSASLSPSEVQAQMGTQQHAPPAPSPWAAAGGRAYAPEQLQHQSFLRTPQIVGGGQASPR
jgi:hypothetical protein